jgi:hypothetical protein
MSASTPVNSFDKTRNDPIGEFVRLAGRSSKSKGMSMAVIVTRCPETGREISTEIECDRDTFRNLPFVVAQVLCPHCESEHLWSKSEAWLGEVRKWEEAM